MSNEKMQQEDFEILAAEKEFLAAIIENVTTDAATENEQRATDAAIHDVKPEYLQTAEAKKLYRAIIRARADGRKITLATLERDTDLGMPYFTELLQAERRPVKDAARAVKEAYNTTLVKKYREEIAILATLDDAQALLKTYKQKEAEIREDGVFITGYDALDALEDYVKNDDKPRATGYHHLDAYLDGGLSAGLYVVAAASSYGKTAYCIQMAEQLAQNGNTVLYFSLEMSRFELMARSISHESYKLANSPGGKKNLAFTERGIMAGYRYANYSKEQQDLLLSAKAMYTLYARNIYIVEGIGKIGAEDIRAKTEAFIARTGERPVVIVDYMQLLRPDDPRTSDKQNLDMATLLLKQLSRDQNIPIVAISSINRTSYEEKKTLASLKESGGIEYGSDAVMFLDAPNAGTREFSEDSYRQNDTRQVELRILKNRHGKGYGSIMYSYNAKFNHFTELQ